MFPGTQGITVILLQEEKTRLLTAQPESVRLPTPTPEANPAPDSPETDVSPTPENPAESRSGSEQVFGQDGEIVATFQICERDR
jgi:hypothetical protein